MTKFALLIGVSEYLAGGLNHLRSLPSAVVDVDVLAAVLGDPQRGGFPAENITVLKNPDVQQMRDAIYHLFNNRQKNDLILLYFSGHGIKDERNDLYLATKITRKNDDNSLNQPSAVPATDLHKWMKSSKSQHQVIILDSCFSGAIANGMTVKDDGIVRVKDYFGGEGTAILTSSTSTEYSLSPEPIEHQNTQPSIYTRYLVEGLTTGAADLDKDGEISADELHQYVAKKVKEVAPSMTPKFFPAQEGYKLLLSKAPHNDRKLEYEQKVQEYADNDRGNLSKVQKKILIMKQQEWGISSEDAHIIEERVLQPYKEYQQNLKAYEQELTELVQSDYPLSVRAQADLKEYQQELKLRDKDIAEIERRVLSQASSTQPNPAPAEAEIIEERVLLYRKKLLEYERGLTSAVQKQYPLSAKFQTRLTEFQKYFKLRDEDIAEIHRRVLPPAPPTQSNPLPTAPSAPIPKPETVVFRPAAKIPLHLRLQFPSPKPLHPQPQFSYPNQFLLYPQIQFPYPNKSSLAPAKIPTAPSAPVPQPPVIKPPQPTISLSTFSFETAQVKVNSGFFGGTKIEIVKTPGSAQHFVEELGNGVKLEMVYVPGGQFMMGSPKEEKSSGDDERPQHSVNVPSFLMSKFPVTQAQYETIIGSNPSHFKGSQRPVESVSWQDAQAFCQKLAKQTNKAYRLPSEAEWEYACRAGTKTPFYFGATISPDVVNYNGDNPYGSAPNGVYRETTTDVDSFPANSFGLYGLHGNVWEWCLDTWHENYQAAPTDGSAWIDENNYQVLRGGSWFSSAGYCRSANRRRRTPARHRRTPARHRRTVDDGSTADDGRNFIGFRLALPLSPGLP